MGLKLVMITMYWQVMAAVLQELSRLTGAAIKEQQVEHFAILSQVTVCYREAKNVMMETQYQAMGALSMDKSNGVMNALRILVLLLLL